MNTIPACKVRRSLHWWDCLLTQADRDEISQEFSTKTVREMCRYWIENVEPFEHLRNDL